MSDGDFPSFRVVSEAGYETQRLQERYADRVAHRGEPDPDRAGLFARLVRRVRTWLPKGW